MGAMSLPICPSLYCSLPVSGPVPVHVVRAGFYTRRLSPRRVQRYRCLNCSRYFSTQTLLPTYGQKKPEFNSPVLELLSSQVSQRRCARLLRVNRKTVVRKFRFMARQAGIENEKRRRELSHSPRLKIQFDDLITSIHTKCKPASVSLAVDANTREILAFQVSDLPARHPLVEISKKKYGVRRDERPQALKRLFQSLKPLVHAEAAFRSDCDPAYPGPLRAQFPHSTHERVLSRRARSAGFGELKRIGFDPLFSLNHTCAMLRANLNRLARRTWCTSKSKIGLLLHLELYAYYHNTELVGRTAI